jgi:hypothetical protein
MASNMNLGQYASDLIRISNELQKASADGMDYFRIYKLALEAKEAATELQVWAKLEMSGEDYD